VEQGFLVADGRRLEYRRVGPVGAAHGGAGGPALVLLHEGLGCVSMWRDFPERLAEATGREVLVYSRAGYGASDEAELPRPVRYMHHEGLAVLPEVLASAGIGRHVLVGHSDGASIAVVYAGSQPPQRREARLGRGPEGLVLIAPHVFNEDLSVASIRAAREAYEHGTLRAALERHHGERVDHAFRGWNDVWLHPDFRRWNIEEYLPAIHVPTLLIQGEDDQYGTLRQLEAIEARVPATVKRVLMPGCGHSPHREQTDMTVAAVAGFVNDLAAGGFAAHNPQP